MSLATFIDAIPVMGFIAIMILSGRKKQKDETTDKEIRLLEAQIRLKMLENRNNSKTRN